MPCEVRRNGETYANTSKARNKRAFAITHINTRRRVHIHTQLNHFEAFILSNQCFPFWKKNSPTKRGEDRQTHHADGRLWESVCAVISSLTALADFPSLNYHLAQTSGAPQHHRQTAISTCPLRGHKMEETHLDKKTPHKQGREEMGIAEQWCVVDFYHLSNYRKKFLMLQYKWQLWNRLHQFYS